MSSRTPHFGVRDLLSLSSGREPRRRQVIPGRIALLDERDLLFSPPTFNLLLPRDRPAHVARRFVPDQPMYFVLARESGIKCSRCSHTRRVMLLVIPVYSVRERLATM